MDEIAHPAVREVLRHLEIDRGLEIHHDGDLPARSGMGSSSSFTVGLLHALHALKGYMPSKRQLALEGIDIEQEKIKETVGSQDQVLAAYGGFNHVVFAQSGEITVRPVTLSTDRLQELNAHLMLFYTGIERTASNIAETYVADVETKKSQLRIIKHLVEEGLAILNNGNDIAAFGSLLHEGWQVKRGLSVNVSNSHVDELYEHALANGALGGKLLGAGGGGFMLLFVPPGKQSRVREALKKFICVPFHFEFAGSQVIFFEPERDYSVEDKARSLQEFNFIGEIEEQELSQAL